MSAYRFILGEKAVWSSRAMCRALRVSRAAYHAWAARPATEKTAADALLRVHIKATHRRSRGTYGVPRMTVELRAEGHAVGRTRVARLMGELGLQGTPRRRFRGNTTDSDHTDRVAENLLGRRFAVAEPNTAWVGDITYLPTKEGWVYLAVLLDLFSRKVVGWALRSHMRTELCLSALQQAVATRAPAPGLLQHTDRGSQYTSDDYQDVLQAIGATPSMSRKGNCWDNAVAESFFGTMEQELVIPEGPWRDEAEARRAVGDYIHGFYNHRRRHSTLGYVSPVDYEAAHRALRARAA